MLNKRLDRLIWTALGLGRLPVAPGTWGSAGAVGVYLALGQLPVRMGFPVLVGLCVVTIVLGVCVYPSAERACGQVDPPEFVLDEVVGLWVTCLLVARYVLPMVAVEAFVVFRIFDIAKPFPIRHIEKLPGAWGVMLDDLLAALYSAATIWVLKYLALIVFFPRI